MKYLENKTFLKKMFHTIFVDFKKIYVLKVIIQLFFVEK